MHLQGEMGVVRRYWLYNVTRDSSHSRGGARRGPGRPPKSVHERRGHVRRPDLDPRFPVHVTLRVLRTVEDLRRGRCFRVLRRCFAMGKDRFGFRLAHFAVEGHRVQLLCEAPDAAALSRGLQGLAIRIARNLNRELARKGQFFADRYRERILRSSTEVRNALMHVYRSARCSSAGFVNIWSRAVVRRGDEELSPVSSSRTWLLRMGWKLRGGLLESRSGFG